MQAAESPAKAETASRMSPGPSSVPTRRVRNQCPSGAHRDDREARQRQTRRRPRPSQNGPRAASGKVDCRVQRSARPVLAHDQAFIRRMTEFDLLAFTSSLPMFRASLRCCADDAFTRGRSSLSTSLAPMECRYHRRPSDKPLVTGAVADGLTALDENSLL